MGTYLCITKVIENDDTIFGKASLLTNNEFVFFFIEWTDLNIYFKNLRSGDRYSYIIPVDRWLFRMLYLEYLRLWGEAAEEVW